MIYHLAARVFIMTGHGASKRDAIRWVTRRLPTNLRHYYTTRLFLHVELALI